MAAAAAPGQAPAAPSAAALRLFAGLPPAERTKTCKVGRADFFSRARALCCPACQGHLHEQWLALRRAAASGADAAVSVSQDGSALLFPSAALTRAARLPCSKNAGPKMLRWGR